MKYISVKAGQTGLGMTDIYFSENVVVDVSIHGLTVVLTFNNQGKRESTTMSLDEFIEYFKPISEL